MGRVKDWLMTMEELAAESIQNNFSEEEAIQYMLDNLNIESSKNTLRDVYRNVKEKIDEELGGTSFRS
jgi:isopropylmalate/homocitrate/citramalate synthase